MVYLLVGLTLTIWLYLLSSLSSSARRREDREFREAFRLFQTSEVMRHYPGLKTDPELQQLTLREISEQYRIEELYQRLKFER